MRMKKGFLGLAAAVVVTGLGITTAKAAKSTVYSTGAEALTGAPQGVDLSSSANSGYFTISNDVSGTTGSNAAQLVTAGSPAGTGNSAIQISKAGTQNSWGSIWSTDKTFDLSQKQVASMWIYASGEKATTVGDGMAFVLQNDDNGVNAFAGTTTDGMTKTGLLQLPTRTTVNVPGTGESMGVWGVDPAEYNSHDLAKSAIQNSWALEFDTYANSYTPPTSTNLSGLLTPNWDLDAVSPSSFDTGSYFNSFDTTTGEPSSTATGTVNDTDNHIASNYPGDASTYDTESQYGKKVAWGNSSLTSGIWSSVSTKYYYYKMNHLGYVDEGQTGYGNLTDHRWHHITMTYTPPTGDSQIGSMTYTYDDKNADTGLAQTADSSTTVPIDLSKFNLSSDSEKVRWGFTGSTGLYSENNLVIFDQIPGEAETTATAKITQKISGASSYTDVDSDTTIAANTPVKLTYTFSRTGGQKDWEGVNATLKIPNDITLTSGTITNPDGSSGGNVDLSKLDGQDLPVSLGSSGMTLSGTQSATITLNGIANNVDDTVASTTSYFQGTNASSTAEMSGFKVAHDADSSANLQIAYDDTHSNLNVNYDTDTDATVAGIVKYPTSMSGSDITLHATVNGDALDDVSLGDIGTSTSPSGLLPSGYLYFSYPIANDKLAKGTNKVTIYATDKNDDKSATISAEVTAGYVDFGDTTGNIIFDQTALTSAGTTTIERADNWHLDIDDSRTADSKWKLTAQTDGMYLNNTATPDGKLNGSLIYVDGDGKQTTLSNTSETEVASGTSDGTTTSTDIAKDWTDSSGILLQVNSGAVGGNYTGTITWTLDNTPD